MKTIEIDTPYIRAYDKRCTGALKHSRDCMLTVMVGRAIENHEEISMLDLFITGYQLDRLIRDLKYVRKRNKIPLDKVSKAVRNMNNLSRRKSIS